MISLDPLHQALRNNPSDQSNWIKLGLALLQLGWRQELFKLCQVRQDQFGDGPLLLFTMLNHASTPQLKRRIVQMANDSPAGTPLTIIFDFFAGCLTLLEGNPRSGFSFLDKAARSAVNFGSLFRDHEKLSNIIIQHFLIRPPADVAETDLSWPHTELPPLEWGTSAQQHQKIEKNLVIMACCNDTYHRRFGEEFIKTLSPYGHIHIHVANASVEMREELEKDAENKALSYSYEDSGSHGIGHYYAVMRFLNARAIMEFFNQDLLILDIDCEKVSNLPELIEASQKHDVSYFRTGNYMPWLDHHAAYMYLAQTAGGQAYASRLRSYIASKLNKACWMLDQSSMCSLYNFYLSTDFHDGKTPVDLHTFKQSDGYDFWSYFQPSGTAEEKWEYRLQKND